MSLVTKQDILKPEGQKFGIGDLVRVKEIPEPDESDLEDGMMYSVPDNSHVGLYRVLGSYFQLYGGDRESEIDPDDYDDPDELAYEREIENRELQGEKEEYSLCDVGDREAMWAWCDESRMEAVPEDAIQGESA